MDESYIAATPYRLPDDISAQPEYMVKERGCFYVGGDFVEDETGRHYIHNQMYVEVYVPVQTTQPYPLILFHGGGQSGTNWYGTPDGRPGWLHAFLEMGYVVFITDVPGSGRSPYHPAVDGPLQYMSADLTKRYFADETGPWPAAGLHTQWPAGNTRDEHGYDSNYISLCAAQMEYLPSEQRQKLVQKAGVELLKKTGPAILMTHSMSGAYGWLIADAYPQGVKGIVAMEPSGPPFAGVSIFSGKQRPYGVTDAPLRYTPELRLPLWRQADPICPPSVDDTQAWLQPEPAGQLENLRDVPVLMLTAEASYHAPFDHITAVFLRQAGVSVEHVRLEDRGIHGNGHMMMLEKNNREIADLIHKWLVARLQGKEFIDLNERID